MAENQNGEVVGRPKTDWSDLWKKEDYWAIWLGVILLIVGLVVFLPAKPADMQQKLDKANATLQAEAGRAPFKTIAWHQANDAKGRLRAESNTAKTLSDYLKRPEGWSTNPAQSFVMNEEQAAARQKKGQEALKKAQATSGALLAAATKAEEAAARAKFKNEALNEKARGAIAEWRSAAGKESRPRRDAGAKPYNIIGGLIVLGIGMAILFSLGAKFMGWSVGKFMAGFPVVFLLAVLAYFLAAQSNIRELGLEYVLWALILGLLISNTVGTPKWVMPAVQTEYYIKTGLVLLGASILVGKIVLIGIPGIFVTWVVTPIVLIGTYWFGQKVVKMESKTLNIVISADMSVCGVSAAIATAAACRAKKEELTLAVGMSIAFTAIMLFLMPAFIKYVGMHHVLGGAWMGGTIDSTGAVVAAGALLSPTAMYVAATIKMIQNILIGITAFGVATYWCLKVDCAPGVDLSFKGAVSEIWARFPKFILGFIGASIVFSLFYEVLGKDAGKVLIDEGVIRGWTNGLQGWFFCMAFVSIGLATNFRELAKYFKGGKPVILYVCGQTFNIILTLFMAWLMFFVVFPGITARLMEP